MDLIGLFFQHTFTQTDARRRIGTLEQVLEQALFVQGKGKTVQQLVSELSKTPEDAQALTMFLGSIQLPTETSQVKKILEQLRLAVVERPSVVLAVPFEPTQEQIGAYGEWFRTHVHKDIVLNIHMDASVVGGCSITWQGKQVTYDLAYLIKQKRSEIVAVVDKFVEIKKKEVVI